MLAVMNIRGELKVRVKNIILTPVFIVVYGKPDADLV